MKMLRAGRDAPCSQLQPWLLSTPAGFATAVDRLKQRHRPWLFILLTRAAASGDWRLFNAAMERAARVKGVADFLEGGSEFTIALLYERTGLPPKLHLLFQAVVTLSWTICHEIKGGRPGKQLRTIVLDKVFDRPEIRQSVPRFMPERFGSGGRPLRWPFRTVSA